MKRKQEILPIIIGTVTMTFVVGVVLYLCGASEYREAGLLTAARMTIYGAVSVLLVAVYIFGAHSGLTDHKLLLLEAFYIMLFLGRVREFIAAGGNTEAFAWLEITDRLCLVPLFIFASLLLGGKRKYIAMGCTAALAVAENVQFLIMNSSGRAAHFGGSRWSALAFLVFAVFSVIETVKEPSWRSRSKSALPVLGISLVVCAFTEAARSPSATVLAFLLSIFTEGVKLNFDLLVNYLISAFTVTIPLIMLTGYLGQVICYRNRMDMLEVQKQSAIDNYNVMLRANEETRSERHEMRHHMILLNEMLMRDQSKRAGEYVQFLLNRVDALPTGTYSDNMVINAIAGHYLNQAKAEGISVSADIQATEKTPLPDEDLCVLLTNMIENAYEAAHATDAGKDRYIHFKFRSSEEHLTVTCENCTDVDVVIGSDMTVGTSKADSGHHGYGVVAMKRIVEKHGGMFSISCSDGCFTVKATV